MLFFNFVELTLSQDSSWLKRGENLLIIDDIGYVQKSEAETSVYVV